jgi:CBS domain-containing protein
VVALADIAPHERAVLRGVYREVAGVSRKLTFLASTSAFR